MSMCMYSGAFCSLYKLLRPIEVFNMENASSTKLDVALLFQQRTTN